MPKCHAIAAIMLLRHEPWWEMGCRNEFVLYVAPHMPVGDGEHRDYSRKPLEGQVGA